MFFKSKITPDFYIKRAIKASSVKELVDANVGLFNLYNNHARYTINQWFEQVSKVVSQSVQK